MVDVKRICLSHEITQFTKPERSRVEVGGDIGKLLSHRAERYPAILTLHLFYYFLEDRRCSGKRLEGLGGRGRILNCYCWTSKQISPCTRTGGRLAESSPASSVLRSQRHRHPVPGCEKRAA